MTNERSELRQVESGRSKDGADVDRRHELTVSHAYPKGLSARDRVARRSDLGEPNVFSGARGKPHGDGAAEGLFVGPGTTMMPRTSEQGYGPRRLGSDAQAVSAASQRVSDADRSEQSLARTMNSSENPSQ